MDLLKLNRRFYLKTQQYFNRSRQSPWPGWQKLLPYLQGQTLKVLDLGCGNGRFGIWLSGRRKIDYTGIDNNAYLLAAAAKTLPGARLIRHDITVSFPVKEKFDLVAVLGVMHHLPQPHRLPILRRAAARLKPGGILFLSLWQFNRSQESKIIKDLGHNDYILDWHLGVEAKRFCHLYTQPEILQLIKVLDLKVLANYTADTSNRYLILSK